MSLHALKKGYELLEYRIEKLLGEGGFGLTYLAFDSNLDKRVAIKEYMPREHAIRKDDSKILASSDSSKKVYDWGLNAFLNEAKTLAKYEDANIVRIYRFFKANGTAYIVMEYCEGGCLIDRISKKVSMDEEVLKKIMSAISKGLQLVHNDGILHRDIKPDNIMFRADDTPVLIDFGAARQAIGDKGRKVTTIITPGYAPLEQYSSSGNIGPWSDIYSLAAVAYLCITGKRPDDIMNRLHEDTITILGDHPHASPFLKSIDSGLQLQIEDRPQSLTDWSSSWKEYSKQKATQNKSLNNPIYANKYTGAHKKLDTTESISARPISKADEFTIINKQPEPRIITEKNETNILTLVILISILAALGLFSYGFYLKQQRQDLTNSTTLKATQENNDNKKIQETPRALTSNKNQILKVQNLLNQLGYTVEASGQTNTRTLESIKAFEKSQKIVATGEINSLLIDKLNKAIVVIDQRDWKRATATISIPALEKYLSNHPNGQHSSKVPELIANIKEQKQRYAEKLKSARLAKQADEKVEQSKQIIPNTLNNKTISKPLQQGANDDISTKPIEPTNKPLIKAIQIELQRLKFKDFLPNGEMNKPLKNSIIAYQTIKKINTTGLPSDTLLLALKSEKKWPGRLLSEAFQDCPICPGMIVIPAGSYTMGSLNGKPNELPQHNVNIKEFIMSKTEITFNQWDACVEDGICAHNPKDDGLGRENIAVMRINYQDIQQFLKWLNNITKKSYRLPTEAEWEYAARAGTTTEYSWGNEIGNNNVSCNGCNTGIDNKRINLVKNYPANQYGIFDMHGNVWEWTQDCWHVNYLGAPSDGQAWEPNDCANRVVRGGSGGNKPEDLRSASRGVIKSEQRLNSIGFRVALDSY